VLPASAERAVAACFERKARDGVVLDLRAVSNATDFFVIVSGDSDTHVRAIAEHVLDTLKREGSPPAGVEGLSTGRWVLIDCIDTVIHVFHPNAREYYSLERLWGDAPAWTLRDPKEAS
jgi:ribosome-associated protein